MPDGLGVFNRSVGVDDSVLASESMGNTCDRTFVYSLFSMCIEASKTLSVDSEFRLRLEEARAKLPPFQIGRHKQLQEWLEDFEDADPKCVVSSTIKDRPGRLAHPLHYAHDTRTSDFSRTG
jgi:hypothetical protein